MEFAEDGSITLAYLLKDSGDAEKLSIAIDNVGIGVRQYDRKVIFGTCEQVDSLLSRGFEPQTSMIGNTFHREQR